MKFNTEKKGYSTREVDAYIQKLENENNDALKNQKQRIFELKAELADKEAQLKAHKEKSGLITKAIYNAVAKAEEIERLTKQKYAQEIASLKAFHDKWQSYYNKIIDKYPLDDELMAAAKFNTKMDSILSRTDEDDILKDYSLDTIKQLEVNYENEKDRLKEKRIGYIKVSADKKSSVSDDELLNELVPDAKKSSPILSGQFDPIERINRYFAKSKSASDADSNGKAGDTETAAAKGSVKVKSVSSSEKKELKRDIVPDMYSDRSESGFSFQEAMNPQEDLEQIMKDLGLLLDD